MSRSVEEVIGHFAGRQHGVVTRSQLLAAGLTSRVVQGRVRSKRLRPLFRGVYAAGPVMVPRAREMAAVLACGPPPVAVSHRNAAWLLGMQRFPSDPGPVDITFDGADRGRRRGIRPHRVVRLEATDVREVDGIPVTTPVRTLLDLAGMVPVRALEQALAVALRERMTSIAAIERRLKRRPGARGTRVLGSLVRAKQAPAMTRSEAEERFLDLIRSARLPEAEVNARVGGYEVDFLWRSLGHGVEVDGFAFHSSPPHLERDRRRSADLWSERIEVIRVTWRQLVDHRDETLGRVARAIGRAEAR